MHVYEYRAKGLTLGAVIVVVAADRRSATNAAKRIAKEKGLDPETVCWQSTTPFTGDAQVVYFWDGEY